MIINLNWIKLKKNYLYPKKKNKIKNNLISKIIVFWKKLKKNKRIKVANQFLQMK